MKLQFSTSPISFAQTDYIALPVFENASNEAFKDSLKEEVINNFLKNNPKFGKLYETQALFTKDKKYLLVGLGKREEIDFGKLQNFAGTVAKSLLTKATSFSLLLPRLDILGAEKVGEAVSIGIELSSYNPSFEFKSEKEKMVLTSVQLVVEKAERGYQEGLKKGIILAESINSSRKLADLPANIMTPTYFLNEVKKVAKELKLKATVLTEAQAKRKGMGAFIAVAAGSDIPSYMIALEYLWNPRSKEKWGFVGKGVTFDSGGLYMKPAPHMNEMKYDMSGAANVLGTIRSIAKLGLKVNAVGVMAVTENMIHANAMKPGDIVKSYSGKTIEILHTDAEGRVILIDAVTYAQKDFKATKIVDMATLTGAMLVALSSVYTGVFPNKPEFGNQLIEAGKTVGENFWPMPMTSEFDEMIKGEITDIINTGKPEREAGSIVGAKFIEQGLTSNIPWIHLDIAGTAWDSKPKPFRFTGATGVGIKTLVELVC